MGFRKNSDYWKVIPYLFSEGTIIAAKITTELQPGEVVIHDIKGNHMKRYTLKVGQNFIEINDHELGYGIYFYSLIVNDSTMEIKKMIHIE